MMLPPDRQSLLQGEERLGGRNLARISGENRGEGEWVKGNSRQGQESTTDEFFAALCESFAFFAV
jgi:hypothetical protein